MLRAGPTLDETDLALIDALQVSPRASWARLGAALEISPMTANRRWRRLQRSGSAWISVALSDRQTRGAILELSCRPGTAETVARELARLPYVITVGVTTGRYQVFALVVAPSLHGISELLVRTLPVPPDVTRMNSYLFGGLYGGVVWRLGIINSTQAAHMREDDSPSPKEIRPLGEGDRRLFLALGHDGRRSYNDLAEELGSSAHAVRRRLDRLRRHGDIAFRCDLARPMAGWHSMAMLWIAVPDLDQEKVGRGLGGLPETRHCSGISGPSNVVLIVSLRSLEHLNRLLEQVADRYPTAEVVDRRIVLRQVKIHGRIVDRWGRSTEVIPVDPWSAPGIDPASGD